MRTSVAFVIGDGADAWSTRSRVHAPTARLSASCRRGRRRTRAAMRHDTGEQAKPRTSDREWRARRRATPTPTLRLPLRPFARRNSIGGHRRGIRRGDSYRLRVMRGHRSPCPRASSRRRCNRRRARRVRIRRGRGLRSRRRDGHRLRHRDSVCRDRSLGGHRHQRIRIGRRRGRDTRRDQRRRHDGGAANDCESTRTHRVRGTCRAAAKRALRFSNVTATRIADVHPTTSLCWIDTVRVDALDLRAR